MKALIILSLFIFGFYGGSETEPPKETLDTDMRGAWTSTYTDESGKEFRVVAILSELYFTSTSFSTADGSFGSTQGGLYTIKDDVMSLFFEFNTNDKSKVGVSEDYKFSLSGGELTFEGQPAKWTRVDNGEPGALAGAWVITGRKQGEELRTMTPGARKTMKILSGTWFQWIAFNSETGEFFGTGGGEYSTQDGKYTEVIQYFSRDDSRVGASLQFEYEMIDDQWHHSGLSSRGEPIYEIWSRRNPAM